MLSAVETSSRKAHYIWNAAFRLDPSTSSGWRYGRVRQPLPHLLEGVPLRKRNGGGIGSSYIKFIRILAEGASPFPTLNFTGFS